MKINWKRKLTSRKFMVAVIGFVTSLLVVFNFDKVTTEQIIGVVSATMILISYIVGEGIVDAAIKKGDNNETDAT